MTRLLRSLACLSFCLASACYTSSGAQPDGGVPASDAGPRDAPTPPLLGDPTVCPDAPVLALDGRYELDAVGVAIAPPEGACWDTDSPLLYYRLEVPPHTGVDVITRGADAPVLSITDRCVEDGERCHSFGPSGFFSPGEPERTWYYGNQSDEVRSVMIALWWAGDAPSPFTLETRSFSVAAHADCARAETLPVDTLLPPSALRGGTYESWDCWYLPESHFYELTIPPGYVAMPLEGSQPLRSRTACACSEDFTDRLVNASDTALTTLIEASPHEPIGARMAPLPANMTCGAARPLALDGVPVALTPYPRNVTTFDGCVDNSVSWFSVTVPARSQVDVTAELSSPYPALVALSRCDASCEESPIAEGRIDGLHLVIDNGGDAPVVRFIAVGYDGPDMAVFGGTVRASVMP